MTKVILFNHIPKTAGSTMFRVLWRTVGGERVLFVTRPGRHREDLDRVIETLDRPLDGTYAVAAHTGAGIESLLPSRHEYPAFTMLRDPVDRTLSSYYYNLETGLLPGGTSLEAYLEDDTIRAFNAQTAFLGGLSCSFHLEGAVPERQAYDQALLDRAKANLDQHVTVGLTERFDETLVVLQEAFGWPVIRTLYQKANVGTSRKTAAPITVSERSAVEAANELDLELYQYAAGLLDARWEEEPRKHRQKLQRRERLNGAFKRLSPIGSQPAKAVVHSSRRLRQAAKDAFAGTGR
jgi:hypothetical protein